MDTLIALLDNPVLNTLSLTLLHFIWQGLVIAGVLYFLLNKINAKHSAVRYNLALGAMLLNILTPVFTFIYLYQNGLGVDASHSTPQVAASGTWLGVADTESNQWAYNGFSSLAIVWMIGVLYSSVFLLKEVLLTYQLPRKDVQLAPDKLEQIFAQLIHVLGIKQPVKLLLSLRVEVPMVVGWIKPVVLLPVNVATGLNNEQLSMLLAHELAHVRRYDYLVNFLQSLVELLLFFHPCVKWVSRQVREEREYCCDDIAVQHCGCPMAYATTLTEAELMRPHHIPHLAMAASGGDLKKRIFRVVGQQTCAPSYSGQWLAALSSILLIGGILVANKVTGMTHGTDSRTILQPSVSPVVLAQTETTSIVSEEQPAISIVADEKAAQEIEPELIEEHKPNLEVQQQNQQERLKVEEQPKLVASSTQIPQQEQVKQVEAKETNETISIAASPKAIAAEKVPLVTGQQTEVTQPAVKELALAIKTPVQPSVPEKKETVKLPPVKAPEPEVQRVVQQSDISQPRAIKAEAPYYPVRAKRNKLQGDVSVSFTVTTRGRVADITFDEGTHSLFKNEIKKALRKWRFTPGTKDGKPTALKVQKIFSFKYPEDIPQIAVTGTKLVRG